MPPSGIEKLPVELLQPIFFQSDCNIALLQASPLIGLRLSDDYVYHAICNHYLQEPMLDHRVRTPAQTYIFARKWMTWTFFKSWIMKTYAPIGCLCGSTTDEGCFDAQWPPNFEDATSLVFSRSHLPQFAFIKARLPKKLLCGPWTEDKVQFLRFLLWMTSMTVDWSDNDARETAAKGRQQAMRERNLEAVELFNHNRRLGKAADMSSIQFAVIEGGCSRSIVYDTMAMAKYWERSTSWECAELDNWCAERISKGDPKGLWLQTKLMEMRTKSRHAEDGEADFLYRQRTPVNRLVHEPGDYDGGPQDRLLRRQLKWNQSIRQFGWFYREGNHRRPKTGLHFLTREHLGDYWKYTHGQHHVIKGSYSRGWPGRYYDMWVEMWVPDSNCQGVGICTCVEDESNA